ncbi:DUF2332 family protein [Lichenihabitans sp. PAMC28606]|uniref:DUF2332 domain-containing protein n=1 Tax=Lichenihabitans sp. PAMC28606 TaxID=2880932 RepID=UPI001D0B07AE|nr:DUF2332 family protein [Lichenihabitans sp. PAMC28606]UDL95434.1 DUF2332 family protein [Lichenihabitans sp. PAMC28606]
MDRAEIVREAFRDQARHCGALGSPFTALLCDVLAERLRSGLRLADSILDWDGNPDSRHDVLPLRLAAGLNALVRAGEIPALASLYPPNPLPSPDRLWAAVDDALQRKCDDLSAWLSHPPQTNEVARSSVLMAGLLTIAARWPQPMALFELGASAGLNLNLDRYAHRLGTLETGDPGSSLKLEPRWSGDPPPDADVRIVARQGCDLAPVDLGDPAARERLLTFVWPDQHERLDRIGKALMIATGSVPRVDRASAAEWIETALPLGALQSGVTRVVLHSIAFQYFGDADRRRIADHLDRVGAMATDDAPLAWLRFETAPETKGPELRLTVWPDASERRLATADAHVRSIVWLPTTP